MKSEKLLLELESLCEQCGYAIRKERGSFRGDQCLVEGESLIVLNKNKPVESQNGLLARVLMNHGAEDLFVKPAVRKELEKLWDRIETFEKD